MEVGRSYRDVIGGDGREGETGIQDPRGREGDRRRRVADTQASRRRVITVDVELPDGHTVVPAPMLADICRRIGIMQESVKGVQALYKKVELLVDNDVQVPVVLGKRDQVIRGEVILRNIREEEGERVVKVRVMGMSWKTEDSKMLKYLDSWPGRIVAPRQVLYDVYTGKDDVSGYLNTKLKGSRWLKMILPVGLSVPSAHWLDGRRVRVEVQGRRECVYCLKRVVECLGRGNKKECKKVNLVQASWSDRLREFQGLCNNNEGWTEGMEDLEETLERIRREEGSMEDLNRTLDPINGSVLGMVDDEEEEELEAGMKLGGLVFNGWPVEKKGDAGAKEIKAFFMYVCDLDNQQKNEINEANVKFERRETRVPKVFNTKVMVLNEKGDSVFRYIFLNLRSMMEQHGVHMTCLEVRAEPEEDTRMVTDLLKNLREVREMISLSENMRTEEEVATELAAVNISHVVTTDVTSHSVPGTDTPRDRVSTGELMVDPEMVRETPEQLVVESSQEMESPSVPGPAGTPALRDRVSTGEVIVDPEIMREAPEQLEVESSQEMERRILAVGYGEAIADEIMEERRVRTEEEARKGEEAVWRMEEWGSVIEIEDERDRELLAYCLGLQAPTLPERDFQQQGERVHEFFSNWKLIDRRSKDSHKKMEEDAVERKKKKEEDRKKKDARKCAKERKGEKRLITSTPVDKRGREECEEDGELREAVRGEKEGGEKSTSVKKKKNKKPLLRKNPPESFVDIVVEGDEGEADAESEAREEEEGVEEDRMQGKVRRCGRCPACVTKCKECEEGGRCAMKRQNKGCLNRPGCVKPRPPCKKPAGTPGALGKTMLSKFQYNDTEKRARGLRNKRVQEMGSETAFETPDKELGVRRSKKQFQPGSRRGLLPPETQTQLEQMVSQPDSALQPKPVKGKPPEITKDGTQEYSETDQEITEEQEVQEQGQQHEVPVAPGEQQLVTSFPQDQDTLIDTIEQQSAEKGEGEGEEEDLEEEDALQAPTPDQ